jgi:hypothetical protein
MERSRATPAMLAALAGATGPIGTAGASPLVTASVLLPEHNGGGVVEANVWAVSLFLVTLLSVMVLTWRDPLLRQRSKLHVRLETTFVWPGLVILGILSRALAKLELDLVFLAVGGSVLYIGIIVFTLGRPVLIMDHILRHELSVDEWTAQLRYRGRLATVLAICLVLVALFAFAYLYPSAF